MPISRQWLDRHSELHKNWQKFLDARKWATDVGYVSSRRTGLEYALELILAKDRSTLLSTASRRDSDAEPELDSERSQVEFRTGDALTVLKKLPSCSHSVRVTSPPYFGGVRDYGNSHQIGGERDAEEYTSRNSPRCSMRFDALSPTTVFYGCLSVIQLFAKTGC